MPAGMPGVKHDRAGSSGEGYDAPLAGVFAIVPVGVTVTFLSSFFTGAVDVCAPAAGVIVEAAGTGVTVFVPAALSSARAANGISARPLTNKPVAAKLRTRFMEESFPPGDKVVAPDWKRYDQRIVTRRSVRRGRILARKRNQVNDS
jgi:hypothetical protein